VDEEGILSHYEDCKWIALGATWLNIIFCYYFEDVQYTQLSGLVVIPGECAPMSGYVELVDGETTTKIWWHLI
jgi:hypothetical protein